MRATRGRATRLAGAAAVLMTACTGVISGDDVGPADECAVEIGATPMRRLTREQYTNTVEDLLGIDAGLDEALAPLGEIPDGKVGRFASTTLAPDEAVINVYLRVAEGVAGVAVAAKAPALPTCAWSDDACIGDFLARFGRRAFRRPLEPDELARYTALYQAERDAAGADAAVEAVLTAMLVAPQLLWMAEPVADPDRAGVVVRLDGYAVATRLAYFLWNGPPDDALLDAAAAGDLVEAAGIERQVRRMVAAPAAERTLDAFHEQWLRLNGLADTDRDLEDWEAMRSSMREETLRFVRHVMGEGDGRLESLLTADYTFVDDRLASLYGVSPPAEAWGRVELAPGERAGLLTQPGFLANLGTIFPEVHRGAFVRMDVLCETVPPLPPDVVPDPEVARLEDTACQGCHYQMDPIGYGFDQYDDLGRFRTADSSGTPVTGAGEVRGGGDATGAFTGIRQLAERLAASEQTQRCVTKQWFRYATGREDTPEDTCQVDRSTDALLASGGDLRELIVSLATAGSFRSRFVP